MPSRRPKQQIEHGFILKAGIVLAKRDEDEFELAQCFVSKPARPLLQENIQGAKEKQRKCFLFEGPGIIADLGQPEGAEDGCALHDPEIGVGISCKSVQSKSEHMCISPCRVVHAIYAVCPQHIAL
jgi:hypothetical protein